MVSGVVRVYLPFGTVGLAMAAWESIAMPGATLGRCVVLALTSRLMFFSLVLLRLACPQRRIFSSFRTNAVDLSDVHDCIVLQLSWRSSGGACGA